MTLFRSFTDGRQIGATLDRNGLRPARFIVTDDDHVIMASESGVPPIAEESIVRKWRLQPGKMLLIDLEQGRIIEDEEIKRDLAERSEEHTSELQSLMRISYAVFCLEKKIVTTNNQYTSRHRL